MFSSRRRTREPGTSSKGWADPSSDKLQASGIYWSFPLTNAAVAVISVCWFAQGGWKKTRLTEEDREVIKVAEETIAEEGIRWAARQPPASNGPSVRLARQLTP
jgi:hypothetical protein